MCAIGYDGATPSRTYSTHGSVANVSAGNMTASFARNFARGYHTLLCYNVTASTVGGTSYGNNGYTGDPTTSVTVQSGWDVMGHR